MKRHVTLVEVILVIALIAVIASATTLALPKMFKDEAFEKSCSCLVDKCRVAQELMLDYDTDVTVVVKREEPGFFCHIFPAKKLPEQLLRAIHRNSFLKGVDALLWQEVASDYVYLRFSATDGKMSQGDLTLMGRKSHTLQFTGQLGQVMKKNDKENKKKPKTSYPHEIVSAP